MKDYSKENKRLRIFYACAFIILLGIEVLIALFIHDDFVRPYVGDMLVVIVLYCAVRIVIPNRFSFLPLYIFLFALLVECLQGFQVVKRLGLEHNRFFRVLIGSTFDRKDIICYAVGCSILAIYEWRVHKNTRQNLSIHRDLE